MISKRRTLSLAGRGAVNYFTKRPFCISFEVTYSCNARCKHCHLGGHVDGKLASAGEYGRASLELKPVVAQISGGEPLLRRDIEDIVRAVRRPNRAPFIILTTNGALLNKEKYVRLREAGVDDFSLSLDYPDERHDVFRGIPGLFGKIEALAGALRGIENPGITLSCVIQRDNFREILKLCELAREWGLRMNFSTYTWLRTKKMEYMIPPEELEELREILGRVAEFKKNNGTVFTSNYVLRRIPEFFVRGEVPDCSAGDRFFVVNPDGTLSPCGLIIRDYRSRRELRRDFPKKNSCGYCFTSIRGNQEKPVRYLVLDNLKGI
jgi:MoaA/NifB/PqqE/SkfB family radical SAM enzyme